MPFSYRLQKILNFRIQKKQEQLEVVKKAEREVQRIQNEIDHNKNTVAVLRKSKMTVHHTMMESYDIYIKHLYDVIESLEEDKKIAILKLREEQEILAELEKGVKVLEKHKEKAYEQYIDEQNKAEMKRLDEVAGQKYYAKTQIKKQEELEDDLKIEDELKELERLDLNEY